MAVCFNCGSSQHISKNCDQPQRLSRCTVCQRVCFSEQSHVVCCTNKSFVSQYQPPNTVFPTMDIEFGIKGAKNVFVVDGELNKPITTEPQFVGSINGIICKREKRILCNVMNHTGPIEINFLDMLNNNFMYVCSENSWFEVKNRYRVHNNGYIEYNPLSDSTVRNAKKIAIQS